MVGAVRAVNLTLSEELAERLDELRGELPRVRAIRAAIEAWCAAHEPSVKSPDQEAYSE